MSIPKNFWQASTLRTPLLFYFVLMALLPATIITIVSAIGGLKGGQEQIINQLVSVVTLKEANIDSWLESLQRSLDDLQETYSFRSLTIAVLQEQEAQIARPALRDLFQRHIESRQLFDEIFLLNLERQIVVSTDPQREYVPIPIHQQPYFKPGLEGRHTQLLALATIRKYNSVVAVQPIYDQTNQVIGLLVGRSNLDVLNEIIAERAGLGQTGETYLVGANNFLLTELRFDELPKVNSPGVNQAIQTRDMVTGLYDNYRNVSVFGVYRWIPSLEVVLAAEQNWAEASAPTYNILRVNLLVAVASVVCAMVVGLLVTRMIVRPLADLADTATRIADGQLALTADVSRRDEIGALGRAFNSMTGQLRTSIDDLQRQVIGLITAEDALRESETKYRLLSEQLETYAQELEKKNEALRKIDKLKDEFLANTSHELRTPLNGIIGIAESMIDGATGQLTAAQQQNLLMVVSSGRRLANMINDILDFSKLKHESLTLQIKPIRLQPLVDVVLSLSYPLLKSKPIQLINQLDPDLPPVYGDENRVQQILHNLIGNAIKFTHEGHVTISATILDRSDSLDQEQMSLSIKQLAVTVADTGIGISPDKLDTIFQPFEQEDGSVGRLYGGTGLGLAVTKQLVELHGGHINVYSTVNEGSQFTFTLLVSDEPVTSEITPKQSKESTQISQNRFIVADDSSVSRDLSLPAEGDFNILVVDDEPVNRQVLINQLSLQKYQVIEAAHGLEALDLVQQGQLFDLVVLDIMMPRMSGYEVCRELRRYYPATELPVIMLTASNRAADLIASFEAGANDYLIKPFSKTELLVRIKTHLQLTNLRELNASKDKFFSIVSHDLRSPFGPLLGMTELLSEIADTLPPDDLKDMTATIHKSARNVFNLLENLLQWSTLQRGKMPCHPSQCDLREVADGTVELLRGNSQAKGVVLGNAVPAGLFVWADENMLATVIRNLTSNALKFTPADGQVTIAARLIKMVSDSSAEQVSAEMPDPSPVIALVEVAISDTGLGMNQETVDKLFNIDVHHTTLGTAQEKGTGLGLIICQEMVQKNGGKIWVESELGQGTTVKFTIPLDMTTPLPAELETPATTAAEAAIIPPASEEIAKLLQLARIGDMQSLNQRAEAIKQSSAELAPFAKQLQRLATGFAEEELLAFVERYATDS